MTATIGGHEDLEPTPLIIFLAGAITAGSLIISMHASTGEEQAVMAPITAMFDGMAKRDAAAMKKPLLPGGAMVLMRDGKPTQITFEAFADMVGKPGKAQIEERIHDPLVRIDNDLAVVWAPFDFLVDGKVGPLRNGFVQPGPHGWEMAGCQHRGYRAEGL